MGDCDRCSGDDGISYSCNYCSGEYCSTHRLPENHHCPGLRITEFEKSQDHSSRFRNWIDHLQDRSTKPWRSISPEAVDADDIDSRPPPDHEDDDPPQEDTDGDTPRKTSDSGPEPMDTDDIQTYGSPRDPDVESTPDLTIDSASTTSPTNASSTEGAPDTASRPNPFAGLRAAYTAFKSGLVRVNRGISTAASELVSLTILAIKPALVLVLIGGLAIAVGPLSATVLLPGPVGETVDDILDGGGTPAVADGNTTTTATTAVSSSPETTTTAVSTELNETRVERLIHEYVNERRSAHGLPAMAWDWRLQDIANYHSRDMVRNDYFAHESPDGNTMEQRYFQHEYDCEVPTGNGEYATGGENIAYTYYEERMRSDDGTTHYYDTNRELARGIVNQWMNSTGHRENILRDYWQNEGIGVEVTETSEGTRVYATQNFC